MFFVSAISVWWAGVAIDCDWTNILISIIGIDVMYEADGGTDTGTTP